LSAIYTPDSAPGAACATIQIEVTTHHTLADIRPSPIAGTWYPGSPEALNRAIDAYLAQAKPEPLEGEVVGLIAPHAGHRYSGQVAAHAFQYLRGLQPEIVAVISPLHIPVPGQVLTSGHEAYSTPLGFIPVDQACVAYFATALEELGGPRLETIRNDTEHSLEIELPFLQRILGDRFRLLPIMLRDQTRAAAELVGHALARSLADHNTILVASSDLSHFYPQEVAHQLDQQMLARVEAFDPEGVIEIEEQGRGFACGRAAIAAVLWAAKDLGARRVRVVDYATSGDVTGDYASVVGYAAAVILR